MLKSFLIEFYEGLYVSWQIITTNTSSLLIHARVKGLSNNPCWQML